MYVVSDLHYNIMAVLHRYDCRLYIYSMYTHFLPRGTMEGSVSKFVLNVGIRSTFKQKGNRSVVLQSKRSTAEQSLSHLQYIRT